MVIAIYPRKSVYRDNSDSVQVQVQMCKDYSNIIYKDKEVEFRVYDKDEGFSGKNTNRPSFKELMNDIKNDIIDAVIVYKLDRISRNVQQFSSMYEIFQQHGVAFISVKEAFDTSTPMGRTVMYILAAFAQLERENTSERVADSMLSLGASGKWTGGTLPSGFTSVRKIVGSKEHSFLIVDKETINRVKTLYELITQGYSITKVERYCRDNGIRSQTGKFLNTSQIHGIITNPVYCQNSIEAYYYLEEKGCSLPDKKLFDGNNGLIGYGRTKTGKNSQRTRTIGDWSIAIGIHEPVICASDWIAAQKRLFVNKIVRTPKYECGILRGVLRCQCGARMEMKNYVKNGNMFSYYYCSYMERQGKEKCDTGYTRMEEIDGSFLQELRNIQLNKNSMTVKEVKPTQDVNNIRSEIKDVEKKIDNLTNALTQAMGTSASGYIIAQISSLDSQKQKLTDNLKRAELQVAQIGAEIDRKQEVYDGVCYLLDHFDKLEYKAKNELIRKMVKSCTFDYEEKNLHILF